MPAPPVVRAAKTKPPPVPVRKPRVDDDDFALEAPTTMYLGRTTPPVVEVLSMDIRPSRMPLLVALAVIAAACAALLLAAV